MNVDVLFALTTGSAFLDCCTLARFAVTCRAAREHCAALLAKFKRCHANLYPVLSAVRCHVRVMRRCTGSQWVDDRANMPPLYDAAFWGDVAETQLDPWKLALVYAMLMSYFPCGQQRIENYKWYWSCLADARTMLPSRLPSDSGYLDVESHHVDPLMVLVCIGVELFTSEVSIMYYTADHLPPMRWKVTPVVQIDSKLVSQLLKLKTQIQRTNPSIWKSGQDRLGWMNFHLLSALLSNFV